MEEPGNRMIADAPTAELQRFAEVARRYCAWAELREVDLFAELDNTRRILAQLLAAVLEVRDVPPDRPDIKPARVSEEESDKIYERFAASLPIQTYTHIFDPLRQDDPMPSSGDIAQDLTEIWTDLREGLDLYDKAFFPEAQWHWTIMYNTVWGGRLLAVQRAIWAFHQPLNETREE